jgi:alkylated DNA repair dioxygenase AlkB
MAKANRQRPFPRHQNFSVQLVNSLFPMATILPAGYSYEPDFLSLEEEKALLKIIGGIELQRMNFQGFLANRRVASFGYDYSFDNRTLTKGAAIPEEFVPLIKKVAAHTGVHEKDIAELLVTEYPVGSVINWHRDAPPFDVIIGISLNAECTFRLRPHDKAKQNRKAIIPINIKPRSLYVIKGSARSEWEHSTTPVKDVRYSITLRTLRH